MTPETKYLTKCRLCGHDFKNTPFVPYLGEGIDPRLFTMQQKLAEHMQIDQQHQMFSAMALAVCSFSFQDPHINQFLNLVRFYIQQASRKNVADDAMIVDRFAALKCTAEEIEKLKPLVFDLRDFLTEGGVHAPQLPEVPQLVRG